MCHCVTVVFAGVAGAGITTTPAACLEVVLSEVVAYMCDYSVCWCCRRHNYASSVFGGGAE